MKGNPATAHVFLVPHGPVARTGQDLPGRKDLVPDRANEVIFDEFIIKRRVMNYAVLVNVVFDLGLLEKGNQLSIEIIVQEFEGVVFPHCHSHFQFAWR